MKETSEVGLNATFPKLSQKSVDELADLFSDITESSQKSVHAVESMNHSVNRLMTSIYLKKLNDIAINIGYFTLKRYKTKFWFMKKWYDGKLAKENKLLNKVKGVLNELKEMEVKL